MTRLEEKIETQCWICPKCNDDHKQDDLCVMYFAPDEFMPAADDKSYIANEYRKRVTERDQLKADYLALAKRMDEYLADYNRLRVDFTRAEDERIEWVKRGERAEQLCEELKAENGKLKTINGEMSEAWKLKCNAYDLMREACEQFKAELEQVKRERDARAEEVRIHEDREKLAEEMSAKQHESFMCIYAENEKLKSLLRELPLDVPEDAWTNHPGISYHEIQVYKSWITEAQALLGDSEGKVSDAMP
jgi:hypothetical protein